MSIKLSISNIAWGVENDKKVYTLMKRYGYTGLEIAPTKVFPTSPYQKLKEAKQWVRDLNRQYGFTVSSMQSIWYGRQESIFGTEQERKILVSYTKDSIDFAQQIGCHNLVFGCPRNRNLPNGANKKVAIPFFKELGEYAVTHGTVLALEANPPIYNTNYINDTKSALELVKQVNSNGFKLNLDVGTMIHNREKVGLLTDNVALINHVHISEPGLGRTLEREIHKELVALLKRGGYKGFVSIEMGLQEKLENIAQALRYVRTLINDVE